MRLSPFDSFGWSAGAAGAISASLPASAPFASANDARLLGPSVLQRLWHRCDLARRAWGANRLAREIEHWPDDRLKDIGLSRADVSRAIAGLRRPYQWQPDYDPMRMHPSRFGH